ncbi:hypothetical protein IWW34DRAFT_84346 [Fusarium oxysporum f. sp. albedinis]|nr:hypothetical protein IWW34DRAFT_84346 [Fusarium oxysporum f. sp. albedinis]
MSMAGQYDHLRFCLCSIAAGHLRTLYKSTTEHKVECQYRTKAIGEMATQLDAVLASPQQDHKESSQALLASTILMAWYSNTRDEYKHLLNGVFALWPKCSGSFLLEHFDTLEPPINLLSLPQDPQTGGLLPEHDYRLLNTVADSFHQLSTCDLDNDLKVAVKEMSNFISNTRSFLVSHKGHRNNAFSVMFPVRNWLRIVPRAPEELSNGSFLVLLYLSNYETAILLMGILCPLISLPLAIEKRYTGVLKLQDYTQTALDIYITRNGYTRQTANIQKATEQWIMASNLCLESYNSFTRPL